MKAVYALYAPGDAAQRAVNSLRPAGYGDKDITVITGAPMEEYEFSHIGRQGYQWHIAAAGGLAGMLFGIWLTSFAEQAWPIVVGNMPIVAWYPNLIIIFELTMLGAIIATVGTLVVTAGLGRRPSFYDPAVSDGKILVGVANPPDAHVRLFEDALSAQPGGQVKTI